MPTNAFWPPMVTLSRVANVPIATDTSMGVSTATWAMGVLVGGGGAVGAAADGGGGGGGGGGGATGGGNCTNCGGG